MPFTLEQIRDAVPFPELEFVKGSREKRKAHMLPVEKDSQPDEHHGRRKRYGSFADTQKLYRDHIDIQLHGERYWSIGQIKKHLESIYFAMEAGLISKDLYEEWNTTGFQTYLIRKGMEQASIEDSSAATQWGALQTIALYRVSSPVRNVASSPAHDRVKSPSPS